ncbi:MAG: transporter, partial [bacterium]|nr:transporter [Candidatus Limimorpha equi]
MNRFRNYVLPTAIVLGLIFHRYCAMFKVIVPYLIFTILLLNFVAVDMKKLKLSMLDFWLVLFQL